MTKKSAQCRLWTLFCLISFFLSACYSFQTKLELGGHRLPLPTKDEVALVDGRPFTLSALLSIRTLLQKPTTETAYWIGISGLLLEQRASSEGGSLSLETATEIARYAIGDINAAQASSQAKKFLSRSSFRQALLEPNEVKNEVDSLIRTAVIQRNTTLLSLID